MKGSVCHFFHSFAQGSPGAELRSGMNPLGLDIPWVHWNPPRRSPLCLPVLSVCSLLSATHRLLLSVFSGPPPAAFVSHWGAGALLGSVHLEKGVQFLPYLRSHRTLQNSVVRRILSQGHVCSKISLCPFQIASFFLNLGSILFYLWLCWVFTVAHRVL